MAPVLDFLLVLPLLPLLSPLELLAGELDVVVVGGAVLELVVDFLVDEDEDEDEDEDDEESEVGRYQTLSTASVLPQPSRV
jgi:hypothetical protein